MTLKLFTIGSKGATAAEDTVAAEDAAGALAVWAEFTGEDPEWYDLEAKEIPGDKVIGIYYEDPVDIDPLPIPPGAETEVGEGYREGWTLFKAPASAWAKEVEGLGPAHYYVASTEW